MIKIDLITGFLGSGKTTFMKGYAKFLVRQGQNIGILENDYGAVNVDMMLLQDIEGEHCTLEMVSGGCDADCHRRRFKTKLIAMGMSGYDRILVEPSGIFDIDEFFDALYEEPLSRWYEIGNIFAVVDANLEQNLSEQSEFLLASQVAKAGKVLFSKVENATSSDIKNTIEHINRALQKVQCNRRFSLGNTDKQNAIITKDFRTFDDTDFNAISQSSYVSADYRKDFSENMDYQSLYYMHVVMPPDLLESKICDMMKDENCGNIFRVKGFVPVADGTYAEINATHQNMSIQPIEKGQEIIIVIGENLNDKVIRKYFLEQNEEK